MTSTDLVVQSTAYSRANLSERQQYVGLLARAGNLLPQHLRGGLQGDPGKTFLICETGDMLGIHPIAAMTGVHIIEGKPSISANLMGGLVRKAGHKLRVTVTGKAEDESLVAKAQLIREDDPDFTFEVIWDVDTAKRAGLWPGKSASNWAKYPQAMMKARVISEIIREGAPDVLMGGNVYTPEELGARVDEQGEPIELQQVNDPASQVGTDVPRETEAKPEAPIVDTPPEVPADFDWAKAIREATTKDEMATLYQSAKHQGLLESDVKIGRTKRKLGAVITEVGKAMAEAEKVAEGTVEGDAPAVLADPATGEVIEDAVIVHDHEGDAGTEQG